VLTLFILGLIWFVVSTLEAASRPRPPATYDSRPGYRSSSYKHKPHPDARWRGYSGFMGGTGWDRDSNGNLL
jgi:hypothetical protein